MSSLKVDPENWGEYRDAVLLAVLTARGGKELTSVQADLLAEAAESWVAMLRPLLD